MSTLTREDLKRALKAGRIEPLYLLFGPEDYLRDRAARAISEAALADAPLRMRQGERHDLQELLVHAFV